MFTWVEALGAADILAGFRATLPEVPLPDWVLFSLPAALWLYSGSIVLAVSWRSARPEVYWCLVSVFPVVGIGSELGQMSFISGTSSALDLVLYFCATGLTFWHASVIHKWEPARCAHWEG